MPNHHNILTLKVVLVHETAKAILIKSDETADSVWLPLSQIEYEDLQNGYAEIDIPENLAVEKELI